MRRRTSSKIFKEIVEKGLLGTRHRQVYQVLLENGPLTGTELAKLFKKQFKVGRHSESIRNRLTELRDMGCVEELGTTICSHTGRKVIQWDVNGKLPRKIIKTKLQRLVERGVRLEIALAEQKRKIKEEQSKLRNTHNSENLDFFE